MHTDGSTITSLALLNECGKGGSDHLLVEEFDQESVYIKSSDFLVSWQLDNWDLFVIKSFGLRLISLLYEKLLRY